MSPCHSEKMKLYMLTSAVSIFVFSFVQGALHVMYCSNTHTRVTSGLKSARTFLKDSVKSYNIKKNRSRNKSELSTNTCCVNVVFWLQCDKELAKFKKNKKKNHLFFILQVWPPAPPQIPNPHLASAVKFGFMPPFYITSSVTDHQVPDVHTLTMTWAC